MIPAAARAPPVVPPRGAAGAKSGRAARRGSWRRLAAMAQRRLRAVFVETHLGGSHEAFARGWIERSRHDWTLLGLPAERWKWRMRAAGLALGERLAALRRAPDVVVATSLIDLAHLKARAALPPRTRFLLYLHENQFDYPRPRGVALERGFAMAHVASLLVADGAAINSRAHLNSLADGARRFLGEVAAPAPRGLAAALRRVRILPPGVDFDGFPAPGPRPLGDPPAIVWNHRWEDDKRPAAFARLVLRLADGDRRFRLILLGPSAQAKPLPLDLIRGRLADRIVRDGAAETRAEYVEQLARGDVAVSLAAQENFGYAVVEAMAAGCVPLLPARLSYPEILPPALRAPLLCRTDRETLARLTTWLLEPRRIEELRPRVMRAARRHAWERRAAALDDWVERAARDAAEPARKRAEGPRASKG